MACPQNVRVYGLSSNKFRIECTSKVRYHEYDTTWFADAITNDLIECFGDNFTVHIDATMYPAVNLHIVFPSIVWLQDIAVKSSEFQKRVDDFIMPNMSIMMDDTYIHASNVSTTIVIKDGHIRV